MRLCDRILDDVPIPFLSRSQRSIHSPAGLGFYTCSIPCGKDRQSVRDCNGRPGFFPGVRHPDRGLACLSPLVLSFFYNWCLLAAGGCIHLLRFTRIEAPTRHENQAFAAPKIRPATQEPGRKKSFSSSLLISMRIFCRLFFHREMDGGPLSPIG
ncbi:hypothetical protein D3C72_1753050 [compost metagenome]